MKLITSFTLALCLVLGISTHAQAQKPITRIIDQIVFGNDTIPVYEIMEVPIIAKQFIDGIDEYKFNELMKNVMIVYPYAKKTISMIRIVQENTAEMSSEKEKKKFLKELEDKLDAEFRSQLENLTTTQGKILVEWIERQTGKTVYDNIREYKSGWSAFTWNMKAKMFSIKLDEPYNSKENPDLELILHSIED